MECFGSVSACFDFGDDFLIGELTDCFDAVDSDSDGSTDYPDDPGCDYYNDSSELNPNIDCDDGIDNDGDGNIDLNDNGCSALLDESENSAPSFTSSPVLEATVYQLYQYDADATDPESDPISYLLMQNPNNMTINESSGLISWIPQLNNINSGNPSANNSVKVKARDDKGEYAYQLYAIIVHGICSDSDGGMNYNVLGWVNGTGCYAGDCMNYNVSDACNGPEYLVEYYCQDGDVKSSNYQCSKGCSDGACKGETLCTDSDNGRDYFTKGTVKYIGQNYTDYCNATTGFLLENFCSHNMRNYEDIYCNNGCVNGTCQAGFEKKPPIRNGSRKIELPEVATRNKIGKN